MKRAALMMAVLILLLSSERLAKATFVTTSSGFNSPSTIDFSQFSGQFTHTFGPVQIGSQVGQDITWSSNASSAIGNGTYNLNANGNWNSGRNGYTGLDAASGTMTFTFNSGPVASVGGFINYYPGAPHVIITALAADGTTVLESHDITDLAPISTSGQTNTGAFVGISRTTADIYAFTVSNRYVVLDDLTFGYSDTISSVPAPSGLALFGIGATTFVGYFGWRRRKQFATV